MMLIASYSQQQNIDVQIIITIKIEHHIQNLLNRSISNVQLGERLMPSLQIYLYIHVYIASIHSKEKHN